MGAAVLAIPAAISAFTAIEPLLKPLVLGIENLFGKGTGPTKLAVATGAVQVITDKLATAGTITGLPSPEQIAAWIQGTVDMLKSAGLLNGPALMTVVSGSTVVSGAPVQPATSANVQAAADLIRVAVTLLGAK